MSVCLFVCLSVCLFVCLSACLFVCLSVCLFVCCCVVVLLCCCVVVLLCWFGPSPPHAEPPLRQTPFRDHPKFRSFYFLSSPHFRSFCLSLGVFSLNFGLEAPGPEMCTFGVLGLSCETPAAPKPPGFHTTARELQTRTYKGRPSKTPPKFGAPPFGARFFLGLGPTLWGHDTIQKWIGPKPKLDGPK